MMSLVAASWKCLESELPFCNCSKLLSINKNEFIVIGSKSSIIHKYNAFRNEWSILASHPGIDWNDTICINHQKQIIYFYNNKFIIRELNLKTNKLSTFYINHRNIPGQYSNILCINNIDNNIDNDTIHFIGGDQSSQHLIWIKKAQKFDIINSFQGSFLTEHSCIYLKSTHSIWLFGGQRTNNFWNASKEIHEYNLATNTWCKWNIELPKKFCSFQAVPVKDEEYIVFVGGTSGNRENDKMDDIYVYDTTLHCFKQSVIKCPKKGCFQATVTMDDDNINKMLVFGYIRDCFRNDEFKDLAEMPSYLIEFLSLWVCNMEEIHIIAADWPSGGHWSIAVDDILQSTLHSV